MGESYVGRKWDILLPPFAVLKVHGNLILPRQQITCQKLWSLEPNVTSECFRKSFSLGLVFNNTEYPNGPKRNSPVSLHVIPLIPFRTVQEGASFKA
jgi:hypothetical protein